MRIYRGNIVVGVEWALHDSLDLAKRSIKRQKKVVFARKMVSGECVQAIRSAKEVKAGARAGALLAAMASNDVLIYQPMDDGDAWVCAVRDGIPLQGFDVVTSNDAARSLLAEAMSYVPSASIWGDVSGARGTLDELLGQVDPKDIKKAAFKAESSGIIVAILLLAILSAGAVAAFYINSMVSAQSAKNASIAASLDALRLTEEAKQKEVAKRQAFEASVLEKRASFWFARSPTEQFSAWYELISSLPLSIEGWKPSGIACQPDDCTVTWDRSALALRSSTERLPGEPDGNLDVMRNQVTTRIQTKKVSVVQHVTGTDGVNRYLADVGVLGNPPLVATSVTTASKAIVVSPPADVKNVSPVKLGDEGTWKISTKNLAALSQVLNGIARPGVYAKSLIITGLDSRQSGNSAEFVIEGAYRVGAH